MTEALTRIDWETIEAFDDADYEVVDKPYRLFRNGEDTGLVILPYALYRDMIEATERLTEASKP